MKGSDFKIRVRDRVEASPKEGLRQEWTEYQIVAGRRVVARCGTLEEAQKEYPDAILDASIVRR